MKNETVVQEGLNLVTAALRRRRKELEGIGTPDLSDLLWQIIQEWQEARPTDRFPICLVHELRATRNRWAHQHVFDTRETYRAVDTVQQFLQCLKAPQAKEAEELRIEMLEDLTGARGPLRRQQKVPADKGTAKPEPKQTEARMDHEQTIMTLGGPKKQTEFCYGGDIATGVRLGHKDKAYVTPALFQDALHNLAAQKIKGGFSMTEPPADGFGHWVVEASRRIAEQRALSPRHGSFVAAILVHEAGVKSWVVGSAIWLEFPPN